jgi:ribose transport system ATP-binding protein
MIMSCIEVMRAEKITKEFPGVKALSDVTFSLLKGEVHILLGENGAGKSTLMKIISGLYSIDSGELFVNGEKADIKNTKDAQKLGIAIIYQEFNLIPDLSVAQNIFLGREPRKANGCIDKQQIQKKSLEILNFLKINIDTDVAVHTLGVAQQQLVEVAKALSQDARILIMDEPTATLSEREIENLFETIRRLKANGVSIIYISHRLQEIKQIGDRITVLRDGVTVGTENVADVELDTLIKMMVGRTVSQQRVRTENTSQDEIVLEVKNLSRGKVLKDICINVKKGEIVALAGLIGAGRTELAHAIFGIDKTDSGEVIINGKKMIKPRPIKCIKHKVGLLPESRKENGLSLILPISQNITQAALKKISIRGVLSISKEKKAANEAVKNLNISCPTINREAVFLSGGNQQKVVLGKWLFTESKLLIFDEPTRGIDVGAREEIYNIIDRLARQGVSILIISSDLLEILTISDRIYVMREGRMVAELPYEEVSQESIISYATGGK